MTRVEHSYGVIPLAIVGKRFEILLVQHRHIDGGGAHWSFPKGGKKEGESNKDAALRELEEETGLTYSVDDLEDHTFTHTYRFMGDDGLVHKTNVYFPLFIKKTLKLGPQEEKEIYRTRWMNMPTAKEMVTFESMRNLIVEVDQWLKEIV